MAEAFPTLSGLGYPIRHAPEFNTVRYEALSGRRTYAPKQAYPRWRWELPFNFLRSAYYGLTPGSFSELETLVAFFNARSADGMAFTYQDAEDFEATNEAFGQGDGATQAFQLYRAMGGFSEPVYSATPTEVAVAGVPTVAYTLGATGVVTFTAPPADGAALTWTGEFAYYCRFDDDSLDISRFMQGLSQTGDPLRFSSELAL